MRLRSSIALLALGALAALAPASASPNAGTNGKIVFVSDRSGNNDVYVANTDGSGVVDITGNSADDIDPAVSPDGTRIAFASNRAGSYDIYVENADGSGTPLRLTAGFDNELEPSWSPDGNQIVFAQRVPSSSTGYDIWVMNADGSGLKALSTNSGDDHYPTYSPDGAFITWSSAKSGTPQIWEMNADGSNQAQMIASGTSDDEPTWSPDSTRLAYHCGGNICVVGSDGYTISVLPTAGSNPFWSPDGSKLLFESATEVYSENPDGTGLTQLTTNPATDVAGGWIPGLANTRVPAISGSRTLGSTLVADTGIWAGAGPIGYSFQWKRCNPPGGNGCVSIAGATSQSYTTTVTDLNATLRVFVTATGAAGPATAASAVSGTITNPLSSTLPTISGTLSVGGTATATTGSVGSGLGSAPLTFSFVWQRCDTTGNVCAAIAGVSGPTYIVASVDVGHTLRVVVTASNTAGSASATSLATAVIGGLSPVNTVIPSIAGSPVIGQTLTASPGTWTGGSGITYAYQWQRCDAAGANCKGIAAATAATYVVTTDDAGSRLVVVVTGTNSYGIVSASSLPTTIAGSAAFTSDVPPGSTVPPRIIGSPTAGSTLTGTSGSFVGSRLSYAYQWQRCSSTGDGCAAISSAKNPSYVLQALDVGSTLRVAVTASNAFGSAQATSDPSSPVRNAPAPSTTVTPKKAGSVLRGGPGNDRLVVRRGQTRVDAGAGNDTIFAADGRREVIDCGPGIDTVIADRSDVLLHCERVRYAKL